MMLQLVWVSVQQNPYSSMQLFFVVLSPDFKLEKQLNSLV